MRVTQPQFLCELYKGNKKGDTLVMQFYCTAINKRVARATFRRDTPHLSIRGGDKLRRVTHQIS